MHYDILIKDGYLVDPARHINQIGNIAIRGDRFFSIDNISGCKATQIIDAQGCYIMPGLIDFHAHVFYQGTENSIPPDVGMLPCGVTTVVDGGSAGAANYEVFHRSVISNSVVRICSFLNVSSAGQVTMKYNENVNPLYYDADKIGYLFKKYKDSLIGIKLRQSKEIVNDLGLEPLKATLKIANDISCPIMIHTTNPPCETSQLVELLRAGDVFTHVYHGTGSTILNSEGKVDDSIKRARARGVLFDTGNGRTNFVFSTALMAMADNFAPDIISSDITVMTLYQQSAYGLPFLMSKHLAMGMSLYDVVAACTSTPAQQIGMLGEIGTLANGACADIAIFRLEDKEVCFYDFKGENIIGQQVLVPQLTIRGGRIVYKDIRFGL
jgi:dihydroorotase